MRNVHIKLLTTLALLVLATAAIGVDADARERSDRRSDGSSAAFVRPGATPNVGEPDGSGGPGATPPPPPKFGLRPGAVEGGTPAGWNAYFRWAGRVWAARVLGVRL